MNYELAKELKDAGFPLKYTKVIYAIFDLIVYDGDEEVKKEGGFADYAIMPTLSELIEACGEGFYSLTKSVNGWFAVDRRTMSKKDIEKSRSGVGTTPEEAVARLWFALQNK